MKPKPKGPSLKQVAKSYKKAHSKPNINHEGSHYWTGTGAVESKGTTDSKLKYKPKARTITLGGTRGGKGSTVYKKGKI